MEAERAIATAKRGLPEFGFDADALLRTEEPSDVESVRINVSIH